MNARTVQFGAVAAVGLALILPAVLTAGEKRPAIPPQRQPREGLEKRASVPRFTPEERARRRQVIKDRLARQVSELQKKKASGAITDEERQRLERLEVLASRFHRQGTNPADAGGLRAPVNTPAVAKPRPK